MLGSIALWVIGISQDYIKGVTECNTYRDWNHRVTGTYMLLGWGPESICNYGSCPHGGERDGDVNRAQEHIQLASKLGMRAGTHTTTAEQSKKH